jgi:hypothetical protein
MAVCYNCGGKDEINLELFQNLAFNLGASRENARILDGASLRAVSDGEWDSVVGSNVRITVPVIICNDDGSFDYSRRVVAPNGLRESTVGDIYDAYNSAGKEVIQLLLMGDHNEPLSSSSNTTTYNPTNNIITIRNRLDTNMIKLVQVYEEMMPIEYRRANQAYIANRIRTYYR